MSYDSEVLADSPLAYYKFDYLTGTTMTDSSGNGRHGTHGAVTFGLEKAIETDSSGFAAGQQVGYVSAASGSALDVRAAFTLEGWVKHDASIDSVVLARNGGPGFTLSNWLAINGGFPAFRVSDGTTTWTALAASAVQDGTWYHLAGVRNGTTILLYVNGVLAGSETGVIAGDLVYSSYNNSSWKAGSSFNGVGTSTTLGNVNFADAVDNTAIYNTALSAARVLAHYEAAKLTLPLRATIIINLGVELNTDQIVPVNFGFQHNYSETFGDSQIPIVEELSYRTNVNQSEPDYQQRINAQPHGALRSLEYHFSPASGAARSRLQGELYAPAEFYCLPIWSDSGVLTAQAASGTNTLTLDTTKRDYQVGSYVGFCSDLQDPYTYQFYKITEVADAQLTLESNISTTVASGSPVFPARLASISDDTLSIKSFAADHEDTTIRFDVLETELSTRRITAYTPATTYRSVELFTLETAKVPFLDSRPYDISRRIQAAGRDYQYARDSGSPQTFPVRFLLTTRAALSEFYGWLDSRQGKQAPFFVSTREKDLIATASAGSTLTVKKTGFGLHQGRRHLEFLFPDGSLQRMKATNVADNGATETWTFDQNPPTPANIVRASFLKFCTLGSDIVQLRHFKGGANGAILTECSLMFRELLTSPE